MVEQKRFALFLATCDSTFVKKTYGGYFNVFVSTFGEEGEQWDLFRVIDGEFPEEKDLDKYDGFIISGSLHDAFGDDDWIIKLCSICQKLDDMKKKVLDEVWELPESATLLAYSDKYNVEMASYGDHLLSIQGHPEYNKEILFEIIDRVVGLKLMEQDLADKTKATMEDAEPDRKQWQTLCKNFLKGKTDQI
ncbi:hypothetical protein DY000_02057126 [Brassica cretica]|uniref:Glutamine amidotransferase domain-containing protein n=2 Tax=Brassica cretica TaxID=69181 RepID=A0ABQ7A9S9_BRACR|nr:hypothetical protein DY000_02057126 [Brassica cretica]